MTNDAAILREQGAQSAKITNIEVDLKEIKEDLKRVTEFVVETKGGFRLFWSMLAIASSLGAIVGSTLTYWKLGTH